MNAYTDTLTYQDKKAIEQHVMYAYSGARVTKFRGMSWERELYECRQFVSYETVIAEYYFKESVLHVALDWFDCSNTTRRQFSQWLTKCGYPAYTTIKAQAIRVRKELEKMYIPEPTGEIYYDDKSGCYYTFDW